MVVGRPIGVSSAEGSKQMWGITADFLDMPTPSHCKYLWGKRWCQPFSPRWRPKQLSVGQWKWASHDRFWKTYLVPNTCSYSIQNWRYLVLSSTITINTCAVTISMSKKIDQISINQNWMFDTSNIFSTWGEASKPPLSHSATTFHRLFPARCV